LNQGVDSKGKSFEEVKAKYIWGGDETCLLASDGKARIIGEHSRKKHEKTIDTGRTSITMYRTGNAAGDNGPTAFLPPGKKRDAAFTDKYLEEFGAAKGSTVVMTKTGFMTEEAWTKITPSQIEGIRAVSDNEDWWAIMIVDGFVAHCISPEVMQLYYDNKIIIIKEEADSSHVNQSYDQLVALSDKSHLREALDIVQSGDVFKNTVMTGWDLIVVGLHAVRQCKMDTWISSFKKVNLHPDYRIGFGDWCQKIEAFLQPGQSFKLQNMTDIYALLPSFWHGMLPAEKRHAVDIVQKHKASTGMWSMECVTELVEQCHIPQQDLQNFRVCFDAAVDDPSHLDKGLPGPAELAVLGAEEDEASAAMKSATAGLVSFQLIPKNEKGEAVFKDNLQLFNHMLQWTRRTSMSKAHIPSSYLAVEISKFQEKDILNANCDDYLMAKFMRDAHCGDRSSLYSAKRKLDCLGYIQSSSGIQNDPERIKRLKDRLMLADSMERIVNVKRNLKKQKADEANAKISSLAPAALLKLREKAYNFGVLTVSELHSVSRSYFNVELKKGRKDSLLHEIQSLYEANPDLLANVASIQVQNQNHVGVGDEEDDSDDDNDNGTSDEDDDDENGEESDSEEEEEEEESNIYRKTFNHTSKRAKLFSDSDLKVGDRIELAWPNRSIFAGKVIGLQDHSSILDTIHDSDSMFPHDMHCARTIRFDDDDVLHLSLPRQREVSAGDCIDFGYWRRIKN
jgi:hypothetical protein